MDTLSNFRKNLTDSIISKIIVPILVLIFTKKKAYSFFRNYAYKNNLIYDVEIQKNGKTVLKDLDVFFQKHNIPYWLIAGTLLGIMRDKAFIPGDCDIDIGIYCEDSEALCVTLKKDGFVVESYFEDELGIKTQIRIKHYYIPVDIVMFGKYDRGMYHDDYKPLTLERTSETNKLGILRYYFTDYFPDEIKRHTFKDVQINIPKNWENCLEVYYGSQWQTPISFKEFNQDYGYELPLEKNKNPNAAYIKSKFVYRYNKPLTLKRRMTLKLYQLIWDYPYIEK